MSKDLKIALIGMKVGEIRIVSLDDKNFAIKKLLIAKEHGMILKLLKKK